MRMRVFARSKKSAGWKASYTRAVQSLRAMSRRTMIIGALGVLGAVMLIGAAASGPARPTAPPAPARPSSAAAAAVPADSTYTVDVKASAPKAAPITITGCLERKDETFRLKDTAGTDAPRSRSWKSGFLKKRNAAVNVVDASNRLKLPSYVGHRVAITGTLVDRDMQVRSVKNVAASCSEKS